jgi:protein TonB
MARGSTTWGLVATVLVHGAIGAAVGLGPAPRLTPPVPDTVEIQVVEVPPPIPAEPPPPLAPVVAAPAAPRPAPRPATAPRSRPRVTAEPPPPPNQPPSAEPPPETAPPSFGVTLDSVVTGDSAVAVPVGGTLMGGDRKIRPATPPAPARAGVEGGTGFSPVPDAYLTEPPRTLHTVRPDYPVAARRLGITGTVKLRVGITREGQVRSVRVLEPLGHGLDEAAVKAMWQHRFRAARITSGEAVDSVITYNVTFRDVE